MAIWLAVLPDSWPGKQDASLQQDHLLARLDVGNTPTHLALKPDGGEIFVTNFGSDSISEINTSTNEVGGTYIIGSKPSRAVISRDNSSLWVTCNFWSRLRQPLLHRRRQTHLRRPHRLWPRRHRLLRRRAFTPGSRLPHRRRRHLPHPGHRTRASSPCSPPAATLNDIAAVKRPSRRSRGPRVQKTQS